MNKNDVILDGEDKADLISPGGNTNSEVQFNDIKPTSDEKDLNKVDESEIKVIEFKGDLTIKEENTENEVKVKENEVKNETLLIPADREEKEEKNSTTIQKDNINEESFLKENLPLIFGGFIVTTLIIAVTIMYFKKKKK